MSTAPYTKGKYSLLPRNISLMAINTEVPTIGPQGEPRPPTTMKIWIVRDCMMVQSSGEV